MLQRREYQSLVHILLPFSRVLGDISDPVPSGSTLSGVPLTFWEIKVSLFPQKVEAVLHTISFKNLLQDISLSFHDN